MTGFGLPILTEVCGPNWFQRNRGGIDSLIQSYPSWFAQLESDLQGLESYVGLDELIRCYRKALRNQPQIQETIYEVHGCHLMASVADNIRLHVPLKNGRRRNFDFQVDVLGELISGEVKTRKDEFPFNLPPTRDENGVEIFGGTRTTLDPHEASRLNIPTQPKLLDDIYVATPESTVIKQLLEEALQQLPSSGCTIIVLGPIGTLSPASEQLLMEEALYGTLMTGTRKCEVTNKPIHEEFRLPTGIFCGLPEYEQFNRLSTVLWTRLSSFSDNQMGRAYRLCLNGAANDPIPEAVCNAIVDVFHRWKNPQEDMG